MQSSPSTPQAAPRYESTTSFLETYRAVRSQSEALCAPLSPGDAAVQSMTDASPTKWHLAHTTWFFETFILEAAMPGYQHFDPSYRTLFNSYYNTVGPQHARPDRGMITRPSLDEVLSYRRHVDRQVLALLGEEEPESDLVRVAEVGVHHEQQHQELMLTDLKHLLSLNPNAPVYAEHSTSSLANQGAAVPSATPLEWHGYTGGTASIGDHGHGFAYDNERPRHRVFLDPYELASRPVTNGEYMEFIADGGYQAHRLWLADAWATVQAETWSAPLYWRRIDDAWHTFTLAGLLPVDPNEPVTHISFFEADAFARWAGARVPTEQEWEHAAATATIDGHFADRGRHHPLPATRGAADAGPLQLFGDVWEWTGSAYRPYPGYRELDGALGEYNGKFMCNQFVLRGGSCVTPAHHVRLTYRNFFYPHMRWQFSGVRLARDSG